MCLVEIHYMDVISIKKTMTTKQMPRTGLFAVALKRIVCNGSKTNRFKILWNFSHEKEAPLSFMSFWFYKDVGRGHRVCSKIATFGMKTVSLDMLEVGIMKVFGLLQFECVWTAFTLSGIVFSGDFFCSFHPPPPAHSLAPAHSPSKSKGAHTSMLGLRTATELFHKTQSC